MPGDTNDREDLYVVEREFDPDEPKALFAVWDLSVTPRAPEPGEPIEVAAKVKNVGDTAGAYEAALLVDSVLDGSTIQTVTLAPGEVTEVTMQVARQGGGSHHLRIGQASGDFQVQSGTLTGMIIDANDGQPVEGSTVTATNGGTTRTVTTSANGAYQLVDLRLGKWTVTVEAHTYVTEDLEFHITEDGQQLTRDVPVRTGVATPESEAITATVIAGAVDTAELTVANTGTADLSWNAAGWQATTPDPSILIYVDEVYHPGPDSYVDQALRRLGLNYTAFYRGDHDAFQSALEARDWDLVIVNIECSGQCLPFGLSTMGALNRYVTNGGQLIIYSFQMGVTTSSYPDKDHPLWDNLGVESQQEIRHQFPPEPVRWWNPGHPIFTTPLAVPEFTDLFHYDDAGYRCILCGARMQPADSSHGLAGYTAVADVPGMASLVLGNDGRTLLRGFQDLHNDADRNLNGIRDAVELWINSIVRVSGIHIDRWLKVEDSGTLAPGHTQQVTVAIDASALEPGTYTSSVELVSDAGRQLRDRWRRPGGPLTIPVTLNVVPDACPDGFSNGENIAFEGNDSGVPNRDRGDGCTFLDLVWAEAPFDNHGQFVKTVRALTQQWHQDDIFTRKETQAALTAAARSDVAKGRRSVPR